MNKRWAARAASIMVMAGASLLPFGAARAQGLTDAEQQWLAHSEPVLKYAMQQGLPLDIVVQPERREGDPPLGMAYVEGRCKLVLSLRGNPDAEGGLAGAAPALRPVLIETMAAHEIGHCWRHAHGYWARPAGPAPVAAVAADDNAAAADRARDAAERMEEGFGDLVGLSWVQERHPARYAEVFAWLQALRDPPPYAGSPHDTGAWLRLVRDPGALATAGSLFERARALWQEGAAQGDAPGAVTTGRLALRQP